ncbi:LOW QUALITY PROTEIN: hypothetical protein BC938DRAFT_475458 [Jimgerdemannia flammicorona]|uniref:Uncharacterized protein n=1 Tax=Jimgerdemannia flammicorona TaxID=994334 RepID=A0A433PUH5_9FUNG|nr:LOW QUALITY PROTEIN: hypothetical protein BC938DRAFT_475458 [Jimgerdemannia flammicorona]
MLVSILFGRHRTMVISEIATVIIYIVSMVFLPTYFVNQVMACTIPLPDILICFIHCRRVTDLTFILTWTFVWKVAVITAVSSFPLYIVKILKRKYDPPSYTKLT